MDILLSFPHSWGREIFSLAVTCVVLDRIRCQVSKVDFFPPADTDLTQTYARVSPLYWSDLCRSKHFSQILSSVFKWAISFSTRLMPLNTPHLSDEYHGYSVFSGALSEGAESPESGEKKNKSVDGKPITNHIQLKLTFLNLVELSSDQC